MTRASSRHLIDTVGAVRVILRAGAVPGIRLDHFVKLAAAVRRFGPFAGVVYAHVGNGVDRVALVDDLGSLTYADLEAQSNALVRGWRADGLTENSVIGMICRNHRGFVLTLLAAGKLGAKIVLLNTGFAAPQLAEVAAREGVDGIVFDTEFSDVAGPLPSTTRKYVAWVDDDVPLPYPSVADTISGQATYAVPTHEHPGGITVLTSGTTGLPKGAPRDRVSPLAGALLLDRVPFRAEQSLLAAAPLFHGTGLGVFVTCLVLRNTIVMTRTFDPHECVRLLADHKCDSLVVVPTMLQRIINLGRNTIARHDTSNLKIILAAGSALTPDLCGKTHQYLGPVLYNMYGSTEVAVATVATPQDLLDAPGTVGYPPVTARVRLYGEDGVAVTEPDVPGRIFAANGSSFNGYTDGRDKERIDGLLSTGDVGHFDSKGRLFVDGRDDDMIVSGGENVYPIEIENMLADRDDVLDVCVVGVPDADFGQRLRAFIVAEPSSPRDPAVIKEHVRANLARYKVPRDVIFIDELPRNATGKVLRSALAQMETGAH